MTDHLTDEQLGAALLAEGDAPIAAHLADCDSCRRDLERIRAVINTARAESLALAERPQSFWCEQHVAITSRIQAGHEQETRPLAWAASFAILALVAALLAQGAPPLQLQKSRPPVSVGAATQSDPDHDLLVDIQRSARRDVPRALEPASLIAQELHRAANRKSDR